MKDNLLFSMSPSLYTIIGYVITSLFLFGNFGGNVVSIIFLVFTLYKIIYVLTWKYDFHKNTIRESNGVFSVTQQEIHYFRIKSVIVQKPILLRIVGLGNIKLLTTDPNLPEMTIYAVDTDLLSETIRETTQNERKYKKLQNIEFH